MLNITNYGAACCAIETPTTRILCDPWFTDGIYLGAWEREDYIADPIATIGQVDYIWVSHRHEDHYDPEFLRNYLARYPETKLWIGDWSGILAKVMRRDGFNPILDCTQRGPGWSAVCFANNGYEVYLDNIDAALVVMDDDSAVINMTDAPFDAQQVRMITTLTRDKHITALLPYTGAGPWPQCITMSSHACLIAAGEKRAKFLNQFARYKDALHPDVAVPFSAGYRLRGVLAELNPLRGVPKPQEVPGATPLPVVGVTDRPALTSAGYVWEDDPMPTNERLEELLQQAQNRSPKIHGDPLTVDLDWGSGAQYVDCASGVADKAHETIHLDPRLLHGLLSRKYHWNTAEIGSVLRIDRHAGVYDPRIFDFLYRFHI